jgi:hypothetical protein
LLSRTNVWIGTAPFHSGRVCRAISQGGS